MVEDCFLEIRSYKVKQRERIIYLKFDTSNIPFIRELY